MRASGISNSHSHPSSVTSVSQGYGGSNPSSSTFVCGGQPPGFNPSRVSASPNYSGSSALMPTYSSGTPPQTSEAKGTCYSPPNFSGSSALAAQYNSGTSPSSSLAGRGYGGPNLDPSRISNAPNHSGSAALAGRSNIPGYVPSSSGCSGRGSNDLTGGTWS